jgi:hypothetical protein
MHLRASRPCFAKCRFRVHAFSGGVRTLANDLLALD